MSTLSESVKIFSLYCVSQSEKGFGKKTLEIIKGKIDLIIL